MSTRQQDVERFYRILDALERKLGGKLLLSGCTGRTRLPSHGVYFFMEGGEIRQHTGAGLRIVRVGTHALKQGATSTLWQRLSQHKGKRTGGGNHRGSIFRLLLGTTLPDSHIHASWGKGSFVSREIRATEATLEEQVSSIICSMPFLYLEVPDAASPESLRGYIERNAIALLSNYERPAIDSPSPTWRGLRCNREKVRRSGLWNQRHVEQTHDPAFLDTMEHLVDEIRIEP